MKLVYTRRYNIGFLGLERFHPFDSRKYGRAWKAVGTEVRRLPSWAVRLAILRPMRWSVTGSLVAAREALSCGPAVTLSGCYHHAKPCGG